MISQIQTARHIRIGRPTGNRDQIKPHIQVGGPGRDQGSARGWAAGERRRSRGGNPGLHSQFLRQLTLQSLPGRIGHRFRLQFLNLSAQRLDLQSLLFLRLLKCRPHALELQLQFIHLTTLLRHTRGGKETQ